MEVRPNNILDNVLSLNTTFPKFKTVENTDKIVIDAYKVNDAAQHYVEKYIIEKEQLFMNEFWRNMTDEQVLRMNKYVKAEMNARFGHE